ncbi:MAG TPA: UDP-3-O-(3-hydroxymyristoyl)glucosamine N-acyltransferase [Bacteroidota bacterium]|nr:UDP-3-O-(3-hydroxymyristoyl)glucosamine N-acyltransferase [Bacteroidota bacterium]
MKLSDIAKLVDGEIVGEGNVDIRQVAKIEEAGPGDITFLANLKYKKYVVTTLASAVLVSKDLPLAEFAQRRKALSFVVVPDPYRSFVRLIDTFQPASAGLKGIHPSAVIAPSALVDADAAVGAFVAIGVGCRIGSGAEVHEGTIIGDGAEVGEGTILYPNVSVREGCRIGSRVIIHSGTVIGSDGFGFAPKPDGTYEKIPQRGIVVIEDDVEIGANCAIDRATIGETRIGKGVKLDNLIQIAHNVVISENTVIAAQSGVSGSTKVGKNCSLGGQVGLTGHIQIADQTKIGAQSGVGKSITESGKTYFGYPAREVRETLRIEAALVQLPALVGQVRELTNRVQELEKSLRPRKTRKKK